ncbi:MAG: right-handed parallel beta-helix repeat-containing protein [Candidatus Hodarchaeales archaeon]
MLEKNNGLDGIHLQGSWDNRIWANNIRSNARYGIVLNYSFSNVVKFNNLVKNNLQGNSQAYDSENPGGGMNIISDNYFDDLVAPDNNSDSIVDIPYDIDGTELNQDSQPRVSPINSSPILSFAPPCLYPPRSTCPGFELGITLLFPILLIFTGKDVTKRLTILEDER